MAILLVIQVIVSVALITAILMQTSSGGLGTTFGGSSSYHTKRGVEKGLFIFTIILAVLFTVLSMITLLLK
jgi:protein translocase SecG subunit